MNLSGKTALITGASSGIGKSFDYLLAQKGMHLILAARSLDKLQTIAHDLTQRYSVEVSAYQQDLAVPNAAATLYQLLKNDDLDVDLLVNNAGFGKWGRFEDFSLDDYRSMIQLNVTTLTELCHLFIENFKQKAAAGIINIGSTASFVPVPYSSVYAATKAYVLSFTEGLVGELEGTNVIVSCLCPGATATNFAEVTSDGKEDTVSGNDKSPDEVARAGLDAFQSGKHYVVTGRKASLILTRFLPRKRVLSIVARMWRKKLYAR